MDAASSLLHDVTAGEGVVSNAELLALPPAALGSAFVTAMYLTSVSQALVEKRWLMAREDAASTPAFSAFVEVAMTRELSPIAFLASLYVDPTLERIERGSASAQALSARIVELAAAFEPQTFRVFSIAMMRAMTTLSRFEEALLPRRSSDEDLLPNTLYRAFDQVDRIFQLDYRRDRTVPHSTTGERLYAGSGAAVQTSYATALLVLETMTLSPNAHLVDLGSGYGRMGLVAGLWRDDVSVTGFEYVEHRVRMAQATAARAGLNDRVRFVQQDLSDEAFTIPAADAYYMYDPFSEATGRRVLDRLHTIGQARAITVMTKGNVGTLFTQTLAASGWPPPESFDLGNLVRFRSRG